MENIKKDLAELMGKGAAGGHGMDHVLRVYDMSMRFVRELMREGEPLSGADSEIVALTALLHDADDYKIFGDTGDLLPNATAIMRKNNIADATLRQVLSNIKNMGYSKRLGGVIPVTTPGKIVSDADMCESIGAVGIVRSMEYNFLKGNVFWDRAAFPEINPTVEQYKTAKKPNVDHFFEKLLRLKNFMMTTPGKKEALARHEVMVLFLRHFFQENNAPEWEAFLDEFLANA